MSPTLRRAIVLVAFVTASIAAVREARAVTVSGSQLPGVVLPGAPNAGIFTLRLSHSGLLPVSLVGVTFQNTTQGPGSTAQLDGEMAKLRLYRDDGDGAFESASDQFLAETTASSGEVAFSGFNLTMLSLISVTLHVDVDVALAARDTDILDLAIADASSFAFASSVAVTGSFPIAPPGGLTVDGMSAAQILVNPFSNGFVPPDARDFLAFDFVLPPNGYEEDKLDTIRITNLGTAEHGTDLERIDLYADGGNGTFDEDSGDDIDLGNGNWDGTLWVFDSLELTIPVGGTRFFAAIRVNGSAQPGETIQLAIPGPGKSGVVMSSDNDGPIDAAVVNPGVLTIGIPIGHVSADVLPHGNETLLPGGTSRAIFAIRLVTTTAEAETLRSVTLTNATTGPGTQAQRDAEWAPMRMRAIRSGGNQVFPPFPPGGVPFAGGKATIAGFNLALAPNDTTLIVFESAASLVARDSDLLDVLLLDSSDLGFRRSVNVDGSFPFSPPGWFPVDGMSVAQIKFEDPGTTTILTGSTRNVIATLILPPNGYEADLLRRLDVFTDGTAVAGFHIDRLELWADDGDAAFDSAIDPRVGELLFTGKRWQITGLGWPVPLSSLRLFVTCDVSEFAFDNATVHVSIPTLPDVGIGMESANDGPLDSKASNPWTQTVSSVDRIVVLPDPIEPGSIAPDGTGAPLLHFYVLNTYSMPKTLQGVAVTNRTLGPGTAAELDSEIAALELRLDENGDSVLDDDTVDPVLASSFFTGGRAHFTGLDMVIPPDGGLSIFVAADVAPAHARDGDQLQAVIATPVDITFAEDASFSAQWPIDSNASWTIDGMIATQIENLGAPSTTLGPSEGPALAFDAIVPSNGYATDILRGITLTNLGSALDSDLSEMRLWSDGGDGAFDAGLADDVSLGPLSPIAGNWTSPLLSAALPTGGRRLFVSVTSSASPTDSATIRLAIPTAGVVVESENDGPRDVAVANDASQVLSTAALLATIAIDPASSVLGQTVDVRMSVRNAGIVAVDSIAPSALVPSGFGSLALVTGPLPAQLALGPGEESEFLWTADAAAVGEVQFSGSVTGVEQGSGLLRQSLTVTSNTHQIFMPATRVDLFPVESMPFSINRGQTDVVPLTLTFAHPDSAGTASIEIHGFRIALENDVGGGIVPADLLSRVVVSEGGTQYLEKTALETSGSTIDLTLETPALIEAGGSNGGQITLALALDVSDSTTVPNFRLAIPDSTWFTATDAITAAPVVITLQDGTYPIRSGLARVVSEATELDVVALADSARTASRGQTNVPLLHVELLNPDPGGLASDVRLGTFDVQMTDSGGVVIQTPETFIERIQVRSAFQTHLDRPLGAADDSTLTLVLTPILSVPVNAPLALTISADIAANATLGTIRLRTGGAASFDARDANTGNPVPVLFPAGWPTGPNVRVVAPAESVLARGTPQFPVSAPVGSTNVSALSIGLAHPGGVDTAPVRCDSVTFQLRDDGGVGLVPATFLDRVRALRGGIEVGNVGSFPSSGNEFAVPFANLVVGPGDSTTIEIVVDLEAAAPASFLEISVAASGIHARDENLSAPVVVAPAPGAEFPLRSGIVRLESPSLLLVAGFASDMPPVLVPGGNESAAGRLVLRNPAPLAASGIRVSSLEVDASDREGRPIVLGGVAGAASLLVGTEVWATRTGLSESDSTVVFTGAIPLEVEPGEVVTLALRFESAQAPSSSSMRLGITQDGIGIIQPSSSLLTIQVQAEEGQGFPFWSLPGSYAGSDLETSWSNFPNPFAAGRENTTFAFFLRESARVKLRILTARGEEVATLLAGESLSGGLHQDRTWDGRNERGDSVVNGVYVAEIDVQYASGGGERRVRKVAVVR